MSQNDTALYALHVSLELPWGVVTYYVHHAVIVLSLHGIDVSRAAKRLKVQLEFTCKEQTLTQQPTYKHDTVATTHLHLLC